MPNLKDGYFDRSVILLCEYNREGAMGFVINSPSTTTVNDLLSELGLTSEAAGEKQILIGGPVQPELCWVVHTSDYKGETTTPLGEKLALSAAQEVLTSIADGFTPRDFILGVGYAGWAPGQLDQEIENDSWWLADIDVLQLLELAYEKRWDSVIDELGLKNLSTASALL